MLNPLYGPLNLVLGALGLPQPAWLAHPDSALPALVIMTLFQIGEGFVGAARSAASRAPRDTDEAGVIDGAGPWQLFCHLTLPLLAPWLLLG